MTEEANPLGTSREDPVSDKSKEVSSTDFASQRLAREARRNNAFPLRPRQIRDVTQTFLETSACLAPGQLVKDPYFTLFEAVGALEIMDPKMDSGYIAPGDSFELEFDVARGRPAEEIIWIMDQILGLEAAWHDGYPLSQTVFTSLHVDHLLYPDTRAPYTFAHGQAVQTGLSVNEDLVHIVLRAYCIAVAKCCHYALLTIQRQNYYEEEDFVTHLFGRELLPATDVDEISSLLEKALQWLDECLSLPHTYKEALIVRIHFRQKYLLSVSDTTNYWAELRDLVPQLDTSHILAVAVSAAFSEKVQRRLATSTPPRPMLETTWTAAVTKWQSMCEDVVEADRLTSAQICESPHALQRATWTFADRVPSPNAYARAYFQDILFGRDSLPDGITHFDLFLTDLRNLVLAGDPTADPENFEIEIPADPRHQCAQILQVFMEKAFDEYLNIYRMVCQNRCRIRRTFTQALPLLDEMQTSAQECDAMLRQVTQLPTRRSLFTNSTLYEPLGLWVKFYNSQLKSWTIQLGFQTEIYLADELCMIYWLLYNTTSTTLSTLADMRRGLSMRMEHATRARKVAYLPECLLSQNLLQSLSTSTSVTGLMSRALWRLYSILLRIGALKAPQRSYAQQKLLYEARMKPYLGLYHDPIPTLDDFLREEAEMVSLETMCQYIDRDVKEAKGLLAELKIMTAEQAHCVGTEAHWHQEIKQLEKACIAIGVQTMQLRRVCDAQGQGITTPIDVCLPTPSMGYHKWWITPQISPKLG